MFAERTTDWTLQWKQQGLREGLQQGLQLGLDKGRQQGESLLLCRVLQRRFGPTLPSWVDERLATATTGQLEAWGEAFVEARTLEEVFGQGVTGHS